MCSVAAFELDDPHVRVEADLTLQPRLGESRINPFRRVGAKKAALAVDGRRGLEQGGAPVEAVDKHKDGASLRRAPTSERRKAAVDAGAAQKGGDPDIRAQLQSWKDRCDDGPTLAGKVLPRDDAELGEQA